MARRDVNRWAKIVPEWQIANIKIAVKVGADSPMLRRVC